MALSKYRARKRQQLVKKAVRLYRRGLTTREVAALVGKSHGWVAYVVKGR